MQEGDVGQEVTNDTAREELRGMRRGGKWERRQEGTDDTVKEEQERQTYKYASQVHLWGALNWPDISKGPFYTADTLGTI